MIVSADKVGRIWGVLGSSSLQLLLEHLPNVGYIAVKLSTKFLLCSVQLAHITSRPVLCEMSELAKAIWAVLSDPVGYLLSRCIIAKRDKGLSNRLLVR